MSNTEQNCRERARIPLSAPLRPASADLVSRIHGGSLKEDAIEAFLNACNQPDTLFITDRWISSLLDRLRPLLPDVISEEQASVLRELVSQKTTFDSVFDWLEQVGMTWDAYWEERERQSEALRATRMEQGIFPWGDVEASRRDGAVQNWGATDYGGRVNWAQTCPRCGAPVTWIFFKSPDWTWKQLCGRAGWLAICDTCHLQTDFRLCLMN